MSVLIKGMEMPECCRVCELGSIFVNCDDNGVCTEEKYRCSVTFYPLKDLAKRHKKCPLVELPPHGRLIDADALMLAILDAQVDQPELAEVYDEDYHVVLDWLRAAPTVIEA